MILATIFVSLPFVVREVVPVLREIGTEQEQAASTLGASGWQTFWRVTLPSIRWGLTYGIVLATARALGEFGAVSVVSGKLSGRDGDRDAVRRAALPPVRPDRRIRGVHRARADGACNAAADEYPEQAQDHLGGRNGHCSGKRVQAVRGLRRTRRRLDLGAGGLPDRAARARAAAASPRCCA